MGKVGKVEFIRVFALLIVLSGSAVYGQQVATRAELDALLTDGSYIEDFEGISVQGGTSISAISPLNSSTQPTWHLLSGVTYTSSGGHLTLFSGSLNGDSSNILEALSGDMTVVFNLQQIAVGLDLVNGTGNLTFSQTATFYHGSTMLGSVVKDIGPASSSFAGWRNLDIGVTSIHVTGNPMVEEIDNVEWGVVATGCFPLGDMNHDGFVRGDDIQLFVKCMLAGSATCICADMDGNGIGPSDLNLFAAALLGQ